MSSPTRQIKLYRENNRRERWLRDREARRLLKALPLWFRPLVSVALNTGMRKGELLSLRWSDVGLASGTITVRDPKSGVDEHVVMNETVKRILKAALARTA